MNIELRNVKGHEGSDSYCFIADLYVNGEKRGQVRDDGNGGGVYFSDIRAKRELDAYGKTLPPEKDEELQMMFYEDAESLVMRALDAYEEKKYLRKLCKKHLVFSTPGMAKGVYKTLNVPYSKDAVEFVMKHHPGATIWNKVIK